MSGTVTGSIEHRTTAAAGSGVRDAFAATVRYFDSRLDMTRIASYAGNGASGGNYQAFGTINANTIRGYSGDAAYSGEGAWGVWRWNRADGVVMYICIQWGSNSSGFQPGFGAPGILSSTYGVGIQIALDTSGGNPWNGTDSTGVASSPPLNNGSDRKGGFSSGSAGVGPVWVANGGTLLVWPRSNGIGGTYVTNKQAFTNIQRENGTAGCRFNVMGDDDSIWVSADSTLSQNYDIFYFGPFTPRTGIVPGTGGGYVMFERCYVSTDLDWNTIVGTTGGTTTEEGGVCWDTSKDVRSFYYSSLSGVTTSTFQPNPQVAEWDELDIYLRASDATPPTQYGLVGKIDPANLSLVYAIAVQDTNLGLTKVAFGPPTFSYGKVLMPWDGVTVPGSGVTQAGVQF